MKTYLLRDPHPVEPQKPRFLETPDPGTTALAAHAAAASHRAGH